MFHHPGPRSTSSQQQQQQQGAALTLLLVFVSLLRIARPPFLRRRAAAAATMSGKPILPTYHQEHQVLCSAVGGRHGRCRDHHADKANGGFHRSLHQALSPSRRKKNRYCYYMPRLRHVLLFIVTLLFVFYVTGCLHLYKRISLKKEHDSMHLQTTTWNFRFSRGPLDLSLGTFRTSRDMVEISYHPEAQITPS